MRMKELRECPFCGNQISVRVHRDEYNMGKITHTSIECKGCGLLMCGSNSKEIEKSWNTRTSLKEGEE